METMKIPTKREFEQLLIDLESLPNCSHHIGSRDLNCAVCSQHKAVCDVYDFLVSQSERARDEGITEATRYNGQVTGLVDDVISRLVREEFAEDGGTIKILRHIKSILSGRTSLRSKTKAEPETVQPQCGGIHKWSEWYAQANVPEEQDQELRQCERCGCYEYRIHPLTCPEVRAIAKEVARKVVGEMRTENTERSLSIVRHIASDIAAEMLLQHYQTFHEGTKPHEHEWRYGNPNANTLTGKERENWNCECGAYQTRITTEKH